MSDIEKDKQWPTGEFGQPIPDDPHAISVWMPTWDDVVAYEEGTKEAQEKVKSGYPRFLYHYYYVDLCHHYENLIDADTHFIHILPSRQKAQDCFKFVGNGKIITTDRNIVICSFPKGNENKVKEFWQHSGCVISSRQAQDILENKPTQNDDVAKEKIKLEICKFYNDTSTQDIYLYSNGMAAVFAAHQMAQKLTPDAKTIQLGFPYLDILKIQQKFGTGAILISDLRTDYLSRIENILANETISAIIAEAPTNPLLQVADFKSLKAILDEHKIPLIIDDTIGTSFNLDLMPYADIIVSSLTKFFCGSGKAMGGSLVLNPSSPFYKNFKKMINADYEDLLYGGDAIIIEEGARQLSERMKKINMNAEKLANYLHEHPMIEQVYYPKYTNPTLYSDLRKNSSGYGGLLSFLLKNKEKTANFYDSLPIYKGPSLGTDFTLGIVYTLLAHYPELKEVEKEGISRHIIRISVGTEDAQDLINRFEYTFNRM